MRQTVGVLPETRRYRFDRLAHVALGRGGAVDLFIFGERDRGQHGAAPCPEILCRDLRAGNFLEIGVDVARADFALGTLFIQILEQVLARKILACLDDPGDTPVANAETPLFSTFALEAEAKFGPVNRDMPVLERRQPVALILFCVVGVADADHGRFQQSHDCREHLLARQTAKAEMFVDFAADLGKRLRELEHMLIFCAVAHFAEACVISVLLSAPGIATRGLDVTIGTRANPNIGIGRRDCELPDAREGLGIAHRFAVPVDIAEAFAMTQSPYSWLVVVDVNQPCALGGLVGVYDRTTLVLRCC